MASGAGDRIGSALRSIRLPSSREPGGNEGSLEAELLVVGIGLAIGGLALGLVAASAGGIRGALVRGARHRASAPSPGSVPAERHRQTRSAAAR